MRRALLLGSLAALLVGGNALCWMHARAMTRFVDSGLRTPSAVDLHGLEALKTLAFGVRVPRPSSGAPDWEHDAWELDGLSVLVDREGEAGTVLLFHGYSASRAQLLGVAGWFHERGWRTVSTDFAGHGDSEGKPRTTLGWREAEDVLSVLDFARYEDLPQPVLLYGFSMGSAAILRACGELGARAEGLILEAPFDTMQGTIGNRFEQMGLPRQPGAFLLTFWGGADLGIPAFRHNPVDYASRCPTPALVLGGSQDPSARPAEVQAVAEALGTWPELHAGGHQIMLEAEPELFEALMLDPPW